jgi:hypothetical protein
MLIMVVASSPITALAVNPAFLQEIKDSNPELSHILHELRQLLHSNESASEISRRLARLLDDLRDQLSLQFSLEESYGYIAVPTYSSRTLSELATRVQSQHGMLYMQISDLAEQAEELQYRGVEQTQLHVLLQRAREFDSDLRQHENAEQELIERSYDLPERAEPTP